MAKKDKKLWTGGPIDPESESNGAQLSDMIDEAAGQEPLPDQDVPFVIEEGASAPKVESGNALSIESAAQRLVDELDPDHQRILRDCVLETGQPLSAYVLSALRLSRDRGEISHLDRNSMVEPEAAPPAETTQCQWCKAWFKPTAKGQYLCPEPLPGQDSCARQMAMDRVKNRRRHGMKDLSVEA